jgi:hypothetical protein
MTRIDSIRSRPLVAFVSFGFSTDLEIFPMRNCILWGPVPAALVHVRKLLFLSLGSRLGTCHKLDLQVSQHEFFASLLSLSLALLISLTQIKMFSTVTRASVSIATKMSSTASFSSTAAASKKVAVLGAAGGIGQPLSLLLKLSPHVSELSCYDIVGTPGIAADLSHIPTPSPITGNLPAAGSWPPKGNTGIAAALTGCDVVVIPAGVPRKPGMTRDDLFNVSLRIVTSTQTTGIINCCSFLEWKLCPNLGFSLKNHRECRMEWLTLLFLCFFGLFQYRLMQVRQRLDLSNMIERLDSADSFCNKQLIIFSFSLHHFRNCKGTCRSLCRTLPGSHLGHYFQPGQFHSSHCG